MDLLQGCCSLFFIYMLFPWQTLSSTLSCSFSQLNHLPKDIPEDTVKINCWNNNISEILPGDLEGLSALVGIDVGHNKISKYPDLFPVRHSLTGINLHSNQLSLDSLKDIYIPQKLEALNLQGNQLTYLPVICDVHENLVIDLQLNPIICDKHMAWFLVGGYSILGTCDSPAQLKGRDISSLSYAEFGVANDIPVKTHIVTPKAALYAPNRYCRGMNITKTTVARRSVCELWCMVTPGCLFYNYKRESGSGPSLCEYADPLNGQIQALPDELPSWDVYIME